MPDHLTLDELLAAVELVDAHIDASTAADYRAQPLAGHWARVTKVCEESGEVWRALSKLTGENPRKGVCGTLDDLLGELADCVSAAMCAIQHLTKDTDQTWAVVSAALIRARERVTEYAEPTEQFTPMYKGDPLGLGLSDAGPATAGGNAPCTTPTAHRADECNGYHLDASDA